MIVRMVGGGRNHDPGSADDAAQECSRV